MEAVKAVKPELTPREIAILQSAADGTTCDESGKLLGIVGGTVRRYRHEIMGKLGADNTTQAVAMGLRRGIIQ